MDFSTTLRFGRNDKAIRWGKPRPTKNQEMFVFVQLKNEILFDFHHYPESDMSSIGTLHTFIPVRTP